MSINYILRVKDWSQQLTADEVMVWRSMEYTYCSILDSGTEDDEEAEVKAFTLAVEEYNFTTADVEVIVRK